MSTCSTDIDLRLLIKRKDKNALRKALGDGADIFTEVDPSKDVLCCCILASQYEMASILLEHLSSYRAIIEKYTPLDIDTTTIILEYFGNVHNQIRFGFGKICQLGWLNSLADLKLLQLLIFHGPRDLVKECSPDFGEHILVSAIKDNFQSIIKIILCICKDQLPDNVYSISSKINQDINYHLSNVKNKENRKGITKILDGFHMDFYKFRLENFGMIMSDQFGKFEVLQLYIEQN